MGKAVKTELYQWHGYNRCDVRYSWYSTLCFTIISMTYGRFTISTARKEWYVKLQVACWTWWFVMVISCYIKWYLDESPRHAFFSVYKQSHRLWTAIPICWGYQDTQTIPALEHLMLAGVTLRLWFGRQCITDQRGNHLGQAPFASFVAPRQILGQAKVSNSSKMSAFKHVIWVDEHGNLGGIHRVEPKKTSEAEAGHDAYDIMLSWNGVLAMKGETNWQKLGRSPEYDG